MIGDCERCGAENVSLRFRPLGDPLASERSRPSVCPRCHDQLAGEANRVPDTGVWPR